MADRWLSVITAAALIGLLVLHPSGASQIIAALGKATTDYVGVVQGR